MYPENLNAGKPTAFESVGATGDDGILGRPRRGNLAVSSSWELSLGSWLFSPGAFCRLVEVGMVYTVLIRDIENGMSQNTTNARQTQPYIFYAARDCLLTSPQWLQGSSCKKGVSPTLPPSGLELSQVLVLL